MELYEQGKDYWTIARRFRQHKDNPLMQPVAIRDMQKLLPTAAPSVAKRISNFIAVNQKQSPSGSGPNGGPRVA